jgi:hypothetical protein
VTFYQPGDVVRLTIPDEPPPGSEVLAAKRHPSGRFDLKLGRQRYLRRTIDGLWTDTTGSADLAEHRITWLDLLAAGPVDIRRVGPVDAERPTDNRPQLPKYAELSRAYPLSPFGKPQAPNNGPND